METKPNMTVLDIPEIPSVKFGKFVDEKQGVDDLIKLLEVTTTEQTTSTFNHGWINGFGEINLSYIISYDFLPIEYLSRRNTNIVFKGISKNFVSEFKKRLTELSRYGDVKWVKIEMEGERNLNEVGDKGDLIIIMRPTDKY